MIDESQQVDNPQNPTTEDPLNEEQVPLQSSADQNGSPSEIDGTEEILPLEELEDPAETLQPEVASELESEQAPEPAVAAADVGQAALLAEVLAGKETQLLLLQQSHDEVKSQYQRLGADFDNFRKRTQKEKGELEDQIKCKTLQELLPVVDNFERARSQIKPQTDGEMTIHKSYQSVYKQLVDCLKRIGVSPMRAEGKEFDPSLHEAVMREPTADYAEGTVTEELMRGYLLNERVLRHAMVKVAAAPEESEPSAIEEKPESEGSES